MAHLQKYVGGEKGEKGGRREGKEGEQMKLNFLTSLLSDILKNLLFTRRI